MCVFIFIIIWLNKKIILIKKFSKQPHKYHVFQN